MTLNRLVSRICSIGTLSAATLSFAYAGSGHIAGNVEGALADGHAPIGVMGDHLHKKGEWMVSYRFMQMNMEGNRQGSSSISTEEIVQTLANPFGPPTVRVVPTEMQTDMHMLGLMYAPSDDVTLMLMLNYIDHEMDHTTFAAMNPTMELGEFTTEASGLGDTKVSALVRLYDDPVHKVHANIGLSIPTGSVDEEDEVLTPMNTRVTLRLPYPMQLGSGTYDLEPGITYTGQRGKVGWGAQWMSTIRTAENSENYTLGNVHRLTAWGSYRFAPSFSGSLRLSGKKQGEINGQDPQIAAPVQTANPDNHGGRMLNAGIGFNWIGRDGLFKDHRLAIEYEQRLYQDVNGVQLDMDNMITLGYQKAF